MMQFKENKMHSVTDEEYTSISLLISKKIPSLAASF